MFRDNNQYAHYQSDKKVSADSIKKYHDTHQDQMYLKSLEGAGKIRQFAVF